MKQMMLLILLSLTMVACGKKEGCRDAVMGSGNNGRLVTFGDSQTAGHATESSKECGYSWANILAVRHDMRLWNTAVAGSMLTDNDQYGQMMGFNYKADDQVIMLVGFNDMRNFDTDAAHLADFKAKLSSALTHMSPKVSRIIVGTCLTPLHYDLGSPAARDAYRAAVHDVVNTLALSNVQALEVGDSMSPNPQYFVADELHLSVEGQTVVADDFDNVF